MKNLTRLEILSSTLCFIAMGGHVLHLVLCKISRRNSNDENLKQQLLGAECMDANSPEVFWSYGFRCQFPERQGMIKDPFRGDVSRYLFGLRV